MTTTTQVYSLDFTAKLGDFMLPLKHPTSRRKDQCDIHGGVFIPDAFMGTSAPHHVVFRVGVCGTRRVKPAFGVEYVRLWEDVGIVEGIEE